MNIFDVFTRKVAAAIQHLQQAGSVPEGLDLSRVVVEPPRDASLGDLATNAAMALAKEAKLSPRALAEMLVAELAKDDQVAEAAVAGPGFINLRLKPAVFEDVLRAAITAGEDFGRGAPKPHPRVNVEYVSANPTGPMHVGHGRGAVFGDALANLLAFAGRDVTREYYINDAGAQVDVLARSAFLRYREALGEDIGSIPEGLYPGDYLKPVGQALAKTHGSALRDQPEEQWLPLVRRFAIDAMMDMIRGDLAALNVRHAVFFSEASLQDAEYQSLKRHFFGRVPQAGRILRDEFIRGVIRVLDGTDSGVGHFDELAHEFASIIITESININDFISVERFLSHKFTFDDYRVCDKVSESIAYLRARDLIYEGRLPPPKGQKDEDWEDREQTLFRSTAFGDDVDRPLMKSDGGYTYFASDIAYHKSKFDRGFPEMIDVWGADHGGYVKRMQAAVKAITGGEGALDVKLVQLVKLLRNGEPVKMSKRAGEFVTLRDVIDEVGRDAVRFMMIFRKNDAPLDFDLAKVVEQSKDNPVFYVQYAHARCASVFRQAREAFGADMDDPAALAAADLTILSDEAEQGLIRLIAQYPRLVEQAAEHHEPHRVAFYLYDLAAAFHALWNRGKDSPQLRFVNQTERNSTAARLALVHALRSVLRSGLGVLGVSAPEEMR